MSFRHEEKIPLTPSEAVELEERMRTRGMVTLYPERLIRSVYFETPDCRMLADGEEGVLPRRKIRIRDYPEGEAEDTAGGALETKISAVEGRFKLTRKLDRTEVRRLMRDGIFDQAYGVLEPRLEVRYLRRYFSFRGIRVTFDRQIRYAKAEVVTQADPGLTEPWEVCELKAPVGLSPDHLMDAIDIPRRRFSKFANGMLAVTRGRPLADASMALMAGRE